MRGRPALVCWILVASLVMAGCKRAAQYGPVVAAKKENGPVARLETAYPHYAWIKPEERHDLPMVFVTSSAAEWKKLAYLNPFPPPAAGTRTIHLGLPPLQAAAALVLAEQMEVIKVKVPLGLPDPTPYMPRSNPLSYGKWKLGKKLFFDRKLASGGNLYSCAMCHQPGLGFAEDSAVALGGKRNTLGLINVVYNKRQFWDGRVEALEEVLLRKLEDEIGEPAAGEAPEVSHVWGKGLVKRLAKDLDYDLQFKLHFGVTQPTQDAIAKALATYLRTLLSGASLYDKAEQERIGAGAPQRLAKHFHPHLDGKTLLALGTVSAKEKQDAGALAESVASRLERGDRLFHGQGRCAACHRGPLFTDHDYHNIGLGGSERFDDPWEGGRFYHVPIGRKDARLIGALRTPSLRGLDATHPYFHDGSRRTLKQVVSYYNHAIPLHDAVAAELRAGRESDQTLGLSVEDLDDIVLFLRALNGEPVDAAVGGVGKGK